MNPQIIFEGLQQMASEDVEAIAKSSFTRISVIKEAKNTAHAHILIDMVRYGDLGTDEQRNQLEVIVSAANTEYTMKHRDSRHLGLSIMNHLTNVADPAF